MKRKSKLSIERVTKKTCTKAFKPDLAEWTKCCELYPYDSHLAKHFGIHMETFYSFLDRQRCIEDEGKKSDYIDAYKSGRNKTRKFALQNLLNLAAKGDAAATIFTSKTFGGLLEAKDIKHIELKKIEVQLKQNAFLSELAKKFDLNKEELQKFADSYFKPIILE